MTIQQFLLKNKFDHQRVLSKTKDRWFMMTMLQIEIGMKMSTELTTIARSKHIFPDAGDVLVNWDGHVSPISMRKQGTIKGPPDILAIFSTSSHAGPQGKDFES